MKSYLLFFLSAVFVFSLGCDRPQKDLTKVTISIPNENSFQSKFLCNPCLKILVVNVDAPNLNKVAKLIQANMDDPAAQLSETVEIEIPSGVARRFQVMALYEDTNYNKTIYYGTTTTDLLGATANVTIAATNYGNFIGGAIVGRYLTGPDTGPTGSATIGFTIAASTDITIDVEKTTLVNGWFNSFASETFPITLKMDDGTVIFNKVRMDDLVPLTGGPYTNNVGRIKRRQNVPVYRSTGGGTWEQEGEMHDIIYGFFGNAAHTANKYVCFDHNASAPASLPNLSTSNTGTPNLTYDESTTSASIYGVGGTNVTLNAACTDSNNAQRYEASRINITRWQFNGMGNDSAEGMNGVFTAMAPTSNDSSKYSIAGMTYRFVTLPGTFSGTGTYTGLKFYYNTYSQDNKPEYIECTSTWLANNNFQELTGLSDPTFGAVSQDFTFSLGTSLSVTNGIAICPTISGNLTPYGGYYAGGILFSNIVLTPSSVVANNGTHTINITNTGNATTPFEYAGTGTNSNLTVVNAGTCGSTTSLPAGNFCNVSIQSTFSAGFIDFILRYQRDAHSSSSDQTFQVTSSP